MSLLVFLLASFGGAAVTLVVRGQGRASVAIGLVALVAASATALAIVPGDQLNVGSAAALQATEFTRLFLVLGLGTGLIVTLVGLATNSHHYLPPALLGGFGALGIALAAADPIVALVAILAGALVGSLVTLEVPATAAEVRVATREFRAIAVAGALAFLGMAWIARPLGVLALEPAVFGAAYLAVVTAAAMRFGAIPFHLLVARLSDSAPESALPLLLAWAPAGFAVIALAWTDQSIAPLLVPLSLERALVVAVGGLTIVLGAAAAWLQDDLEHTVGYSIVQDAGFVILGLAILDPVTWTPTREWILIFVVVKTAFAAWALAVRARFGTRRIRDLDGWARRSPILGVAFVLLVVATIGMPGLLAWEVRGRLIGLTLENGLLRAVVTVGAAASLAYYGRIILAGLRRPSPGVATDRGDRPVWGRRLVTPAGVGSAGVGSAGVGSAVAASAVAGPTRFRRSGQGVERVGAGLDRTLGLTWTANRAPIAAVGVLLLACIAVLTGSGGLGIQAAAAARAPQPGGPVESFAPIESSGPGGTNGPDESASPGAVSPGAPADSTPPAATASPAAAPAAPSTLGPSIPPGSPVSPTPSQSPLPTP